MLSFVTSADSTVEVVVLELLSTELVVVMVVELSPPVTVVELEAPVVVDDVEILFVVVAVDDWAVVVVVVGVNV